MTIQKGEVKREKTIVGLIDGTVGQLGPTIVYMGESF